MHLITGPQNTQSVQVRIHTPLTGEWLVLESVPPYVNDGMRTNWCKISPTQYEYYVTSL